MKNLKIIMFLASSLFFATSCMKKCRLDGCQMIADHTHFFGAEAGKDGSAIVKDSVEASLTVVSGLPWYRRVFKRKYYTQDGLKYKKFDALRYSGKNKPALNTFWGKEKSHTFKEKRKTITKTKSGTTIYSE
jgi:hypothetical protein